MIDKLPLSYLADVFAFADQD